MTHKDQLTTCHHCGEQISEHECISKGLYPAAHCDADTEWFYCSEECAGIDGFAVCEGCSDWFRVNPNNPSPYCGYCYEYDDDLDDEDDIDENEAWWLEDEEEDENFDG